MAGRQADRQVSGFAEPPLQSRATKKLCKNHGRERLASRLREQYPRSGSASVSERTKVDVNVAPVLKADNATIDASSVIRVHLGDNAAR